jgi:hypothetical protein
MTVDIDMSAAQPPTSSTIKVAWPSSGLVTDKTIQQVNPKVVQDLHIGNCIIEKNTPDELNAAMFVGVGNVQLPANGQSLINLQVFGGAMAPDVAAALLTTVPANGTAGPTDVGIVIQPHDLTDGATLTVPALTALGYTAPPDVIDAGTVTLDNIEVGATSSGYDVVHIEVWNAKPNANQIVWIIYSAGGSLKPRGLPPLPDGVALTDIAGSAAITTGISAGVTKYATGVTRKPWEAIGPDTLVDIGTAAITQVPEGTQR